MKMHPTTVRLTEDDQTFLASLNIAGASTISDKIRAMIEDRRLQQDAVHDYRSALALATHLIAPITESTKVAENEIGMHSQFVRRVLEWVPELVATLLSEGECGDEPPTEKDLRRLETILVDRSMLLLDILLQTYLARDSALYDGASLSAAKLTPIKRLFRLVEEDDNENNL